MARPVRNPAGRELAPTQTRPLSARANGCRRTRLSNEGREGLKGREGRGPRSFQKEKTMTMQTVPLSSLEPSRGNPRKVMDRKTIEGLAASIKTDGLLHNLVTAIESELGNFK
jgi:hypothetical protein